MKVNRLFLVMVLAAEKLSAMEVPSDEDQNGKS